ncbi:hypothetical protein CJ030_MR1G028904 [Morella rubra]|uniref:DC1 domain-containing protein n=1 Tax=Morella rubra TaxID=262757 RepID=A0A6A1WVM2_9ROSI|nr:hypothetical protein CJ030_MR1G028904 [Morella rubra]
MVDTNYGVYYCSSCNFLAHLHCAATAEERDETFVQDLKDTEHVGSTNMPAHEDFIRDESSDLPTYIAKKMKLGEGGIEIAEEIKHFSHEHELKLTDELDINGQCDGCVLPIFSPFYKCTVCTFFLHRSCAELPRKKQHSLHRHPLFLRSRVFWCNVCRCGSKGFKYYCDKCGFNLDVRCSLVPDILKHDGHEHQLISCHSSDRVKCSCCNSSSRYIFI